MWLHCLPEMLPDESLLVCADVWKVRRHQLH
jgi:hypothetical protein